MGGGVETGDSSAPPSGRRGPALGRSLWGAYSDLHHGGAYSYQHTRDGAPTAGGVGGYPPGQHWRLFPLGGPRVPLCHDGAGNIFLEVIPKGFGYTPYRDALVAHRILPRSHFLLDTGAEISAVAPQNAALPTLGLRLLWVYNGAVVRR